MTVTIPVTTRSTKLTLSTNPVFPARVHLKLVVSSNLMFFITRVALPFLSNLPTNAAGGMAGSSTLVPFSSSTLRYT